MMFRISPEFSTIIAINGFNGVGAFFQHLLQEPARRSGGLVGQNGRKEFPAV
jgi:hypothetical protein